MRFTELMINDWVYVDWVTKGNFQVTGIDKIEMQTTATSNYMGHEYAHPIPITPEILEANGITLLEVGDNGPATPKKHLNRYEKWFIHTTWKDTFLWYDRMADHWHLQDMSGARFHHVHELQHALRLADLNDMADNFIIEKGGSQ